MQERKAAPISDFFKFTTIGQSAVGRIEKFIPANGDMSAMIVMAPVMLSGGRGERLQQWERCAIGLSTDLAQKITQRDVEQFVSMTFDDTEPTTKGSKRKIFKVFLLTGAEIRELAETADKTHRQDPYRDENKEAAKSPVPGVDESDDLPF